MVTPVAAQDDIVLSDRYNVEAGKPYPVVDGKKYYLECPTGILSVKVRGKSWMIQTLSSETLTQKTRKEYTDMPEDLDVESIDYFGDRVFVFYSLWDKPNEKEQLFYREIDPESGTFSGKSVKMLSIKGKVTGSMIAAGFYRFKVTDKFDMVTSENKKFMLVQYRKKRDKKDKDGPNTLEVAVFDEQLEKAWSGEVRLPYDAEKMSALDYTVDNKGRIAMIARVYSGTEEKVKNREPQDYRYELIRGGTFDEALVIVPIELPSKYILSMTLFEQQDGSLRASGYYNGLDNKTLTADGLYTCSFSDKGNLENARFFEIPREILNMYVTKREAKKNDKNEDKGEEVGFRNLSLVKILTDDDGSFVVIGEQRFITVECTTDSKGNSRCYDVYHADDLLVSSFDAKGELSWMKRIPKRIRSLVPIGKSFSYIHSDNEHHFMHFDQHKNVVVAVDEVPGSKGKLVVMVDRINEQTGAVAREIVLNTEEVKDIKLYQLAQDRVVRTSNSELLMEAYIKGKEDILIRIQAK